ncbi:MAG TPA: YdcF family protein [Mycobacteriales bacterium]
MLRSRAPRPRGRWPRRIAIGLAGLVLLAVVLFVVTAVRVWQVGREDHRPPSDAILVLGAAQYDGRPSATLAARLDHALVLWRQRVAPVVVTVGGKRPGDQFTEAGTGRSYLEQHGIPPAQVVAVPSGTDTYNSLQAAKPVLDRRGWHSLVLVSDPWHELRSRAMAGYLGFAATTSPTHTGPASHGRLTELHYVLRETVAYLYFRAGHP